MSDCDKTQTELPKSVATRGAVNVGNLRMQVYKSDKIHIHDDVQKLVYECKSKRYFQMVFDGFLRDSYKYPVGTVAVAVGDSGKNGESANLVLRRGRNGWTMALAKKDDFLFKKKMVILTDDVLRELDDFVQSA